MGSPPNEFEMILIDTSSSMLEKTIVMDALPGDEKKKKKKKKKKDGSGGGNYLSRFDAAIEASQTMVITKKDIVQTDKFGIITFNDNEAVLVKEFSNDHEGLVRALDAIEMVNDGAAKSKKKKLGGALSLAIQEFAKQLKFIGNLMLRIFIITDELTELDNHVHRLTEIARDIGVYIDILYLGVNYEGMDSDSDSRGYFIDDDIDSEELKLDFALETGNPQGSSGDGVLLPGIEPETVTKPSTHAGESPSRRLHFRDIREIAQMTDGLFLDCGESMSLVVKHARKLGDIKDLEEGLGAFESAPVREKKLMSAIAEQLVPLGISEIQDQLEGKSNLKCSICFQSTSPNGAPFYATGRRCSYCQRTMHLECAAKWAEQDQGSEESWIFRCPFCFHLLKVDPSVTKLMDLQTMRQNVAKAASGKIKPNITTASILSPSEIENLFEPCEVCGVLLEPNEIVYQCHNCRAPYHEHCFSQVLEQNESHCRRCGYEIQL
ncbi:MAG: VWA domain-containing protein [Promethearchaeota archaeon]